MKLNGVIDITDIVKDIKNLINQQKNPTRNGMLKVLNDVQNKYKIETSIYETVECLSTNGNMTNIENVSDKVLYSRLEPYKIILINKLIDKCGQDKANQIIKEYELEV